MTLIPLAPASCQANAERLDSEIVYDRDFDYDYFGFKTLERSYLLRVNGKVVERPQHMLMRVAVGIHGEDIEAGAMQCLLFCLCSMGHVGHAWAAARCCAMLYVHLLAAH